MKKILLVILIAFVVNNDVRSQDYADVYATKIANRMKDSLSLTDSQKVEIYNISKNIGEQKKNVWMQYSGSDSLIHENLQRVENMRDERYRIVLGEARFLEYKRKKNALLNNN